MDKQKPYHITITDNATGEVLNDLDTNCIIGAVHAGEDPDKGNAVNGIVKIKCSPFAIAHTLITVKKIIERLYAKSPELPAFEHLLGLQPEEIIEE